MIRIENKVPFIYANKSRDFQLLCRMLSVIQNGIKSDIDDMLNIIDTDNIRNQLLNLLSSKVGYFPSFQLDDFALRIICDGFPYMIKNKGNIRGIHYAVNMFLKINKINLTSNSAQVNVELINDTVGNYALTITLPIEFKFLDLKILESLLEYVIPTGCVIKYLFEKRIGDGTKENLNSSISVYSILTAELIDPINSGNIISLEDISTAPTHGMISVEQIISLEDISGGVINE